MKKMIPPAAPATPAQRKAAERARKRAAGFVLMPELWVLPAQRPRLEVYLAKLAREAALMT